MTKTTETKFDATDPVCILIKARELLMKRGVWIKGAEQTITDSGKEQYCSIGAIFKVTGQVRWGGGVDQALVALGTAITGKRLNDAESEIVRFNDAHSRRKASVISKFTKAIKIAAEEKKACRKR